MLQKTQKRKKNRLMRMLNENIIRFVASALDLEGPAFWKIFYVRIGRSKKEVACDPHCPLDLL
jgi:hypothetical protein